MKHRITDFMATFFIIALLLVLGSSVYAADRNTVGTNITQLVEKSEGKVYVSWEKKDVDGYQIRWSLNSSMNNAKTASTGKTYFYRKGLIGGKTYFFSVRTYKLDNRKKVYSKWSTIKSIKLRILPVKTSITSVKAKQNNGFIVKWKTSSKVKGYQVRYSADSSFRTRKTASTTKGFISRSKLSKGTYYVSVRTYNVSSDGKKYYSAWSDTKSVVVGADPSYVKAGTYIYNYGTAHKKDMVKVYSVNGSTVTFSIIHEEPYSADKSYYYETDQITTTVKNNRTDVFRWNDNWCNQGTGSLHFENQSLEVEMSFSYRESYSRWNWWKKSPKLAFQGQTSNCVWYSGWMIGNKAGGMGRIVSIDIKGKNLVMYASLRKVNGEHGEYGNPLQYTNYSFEIANNAVFRGGDIYENQYYTLNDFLKCCKSLNGLVLQFKVVNGKVEEAVICS